MDDDLRVESSTARVVLVTLEAFLVPTEVQFSKFEIVLVIGIENSLFKELDVDKTSLVDVVFSSEFALALETSVDRISSVEWEFPGISEVTIENSELELNPTEMPAETSDANDPGVIVVTLISEVDGTSSIVL